MSLGSESSRLETSARTVLAFDFGEKRIGAAVGQDLLGTAQALETIQVRHGRVDWAAVERLVETWSPHCFVLGDPGLAGADSHPLDAALTKFARRLEGRFHCPVHWFDETLSSAEARHRGAGSARVGVDAVAAEIILESWFAHEKAAGRAL